MSYEPIHFIINPTSGGGSCGKTWAQARQFIESTLGNFSFEFTGGKGHAIELTRRAADKAKKIIAIGGDGTISEIVSGIIQSGNKNVEIGVLNLGTGGDFCRTLQIRSNINKGLEKLKNGSVIQTDVGCITFIGNNGKSEERYFINIAGCGMAGEVVRTINKSKKMFGSFSYYLSSVQNLFSYANKKVLIKIDDEEPKEFVAVTVAVCNGKYFGGGMQISPKSEINDGLFNITIIGDWNILEKIIYSSKLYGSNILNVPKVFSFVAKKIEIQNLSGDDSPAFIDSDGEDVGVIPMTVKIIPGAVKFII
jgi:YegS/Rv2252/BmrU family lipid kinase